MTTDPTTPSKTSVLTSDRIDEWWSNVNAVISFGTPAQRNIARSLLADADAMLREGLARVDALTKDLNEMRCELMDAYRARDDTRSALAAATDRISGLKALVGTLRDHFGCEVRNVDDVSVQQHSREIVAAATEAGVRVREAARAVDRFARERGWNNLTTTWPVPGALLMALREALAAEGASSEKPKEAANAPDADFLGRCLYQTRFADRVHACQKPRGHQDEHEWAGAAASERDGGVDRRIMQWLRQIASRGPGHSCGEIDNLLGAIGHSQETAKPTPPNREEGGAWARLVKQLAEVRSWIAGNHPRDGIDLVRGNWGAMVEGVRVHIINALDPILSEMEREIDRMRGGEGPSSLAEQVVRIFDEPVSDRAAARKAVVMVARAVESQS